MGHLAAAVTSSLCNEHYCCTQQGDTMACAWRSALMRSLGCKCSAACDGGWCSAGCGRRPAQTLFVPATRQVLTRMLVGSCSATPLALHQHTACMRMRRTRLCCTAHRSIPALHMFMLRYVWSRCMPVGVRATLVAYAVGTCKGVSLSFLCVSCVFGKFSSATCMLCQQHIAQVTSTCWSLLRLCTGSASS